MSTVAERRIVARNGAGMVLADPDLLQGVPGIRDFLAANVADPICRLKWFTVTGWRWYVLAFDWEPSPMAWCFVTSPHVPEGEEGTDDVSELAKLTLFGGSLGVERDLYWRPKRLSQAVRTPRQ